MANVAVKNIVKENRIGKFTVSHDLIKDNPEEVLELFANVIVVKAESLFHRRLIEYTAFSEMFEPISEGVVEPRYMIEVTKEKLDYGGFEYHFKAVKGDL